MSRKNISHRSTNSTYFLKNVWKLDRFATVGRRICNQLILQSPKPQKIIFSFGPWKNLSHGPELLSAPLGLIILFLQFLVLPRHLKCKKTFFCISFRRDHVAIFSSWFFSTIKEIYIYSWIKLSYVLGISINQNHHADMLSSIEVKNNHKKEIKNNNNQQKKCVYK